MNSQPNMQTAEQRITELLKSLVEHRTLASDTQALDACIDWVSNYITVNSVSHDKPLIQTFRSNDKPSLYCSYGSDPVTVLFSGHLDVVQSDYPLAFQMRELHETREFQGRGVADMKGPIAALIDIFVQEPHQGMGLLLTTDEEIGGKDGTAYMLQHIPLPKVVLLPDGGARMNLVTEQKGMLPITLHATGKPAHASRPWMGKNALEIMYRGYQRLLDIYPIPANEEDWSVSIALTDLRNQGNAKNTIPNKAEAYLDIRYPSTGEQSATPQNIYETIIRDLQPLGITADPFSSTPGFVLDTTSAFVTQLQKAAQKVIGHELPLVREAGASDARHYPEQVPVLIYQPVCRGWHTNDERITIESLLDFREISAEFVRAIL